MELRLTGSSIDAGGNPSVNKLSPTFYLGEGEDWTVASGERGDPGRVFLHADGELGWAELLPRRLHP